MFTDAAFSNFTPHINRTSKSIAATLAPLPDRQWYEKEKHLARLAHLHDAVTAERQREETFRPKINAKAHGSDEGRVPLLERTNAHRPAVAPEDPEMTLKPKINEVSKRMGEVARSQVDDGHLVRKQVQQLWADFADGKNMSAASVVRALQSIGIKDLCLLDKVLLALNVDPYDEAKRYVEYDRFVRVMNMALKAAIARPATAAASAPSAPATEPPQGGSSASTAGAEKALKRPSCQLGSVAAATSDGAISAPVQEKIGSRKQPNESKENSVLELRKQHQQQPPKPKVVHAAPAAEQPQSSRNPPQATAAKKASSPPTGNSAHPQPTVAEVPPRSVSPAPAATAKKKKAHYDPYGSCTFSPSINKNIDVSTKGPVTRDRFTGGRSLADLASKLQKEALEEEECTFHPRLGEIHNQHPAVVAGVAKAGLVSLRSAATPGFEKAVKRMERGREQAVQPFEEMLRNPSRSSSASAVVDFTSGATASGAPTEVQPFRLRSEVRSLEREAQKPLLYVDVDLPHGRCGRIGVHRGDDAEQLARNFCASYSLDQNTVIRLTAILQEKLEIVQREKTRSVWV
jgi:hypothetical protein